MGYFLAVLFGIGAVDGKEDSRATRAEELKSFTSILAPGQLEISLTQDGIAYVDRPLRFEPLRQRGSVSFEVCMALRHL